MNCNTGGMHMNYSSLDEMYRDQLRVLYGADYDCKDIYASLGTAATDPRIATEAMALLTDSRESVAELTDHFKSIGLTTRGEPCECFDSLAMDCDDMERKTTQTAIRDTGFVSMLLRIGQYKITGYDIARRWAEAIGSEAGADVLETIKVRHRIALARIERLADAVIPATNRQLVRA